MCLKCTFLPKCCCRAQEEFEARAESIFSTVGGSLLQLVNSKVKVRVSSLTESILYQQDVNTLLDTKYTKDSPWKQTPHAYSHNILIWKADRKVRHRKYSCNWRHVQWIWIIIPRFLQEKWTDSACSFPKGDKRNLHSCRS